MRGPGSVRRVLWSASFLCWCSLLPGQGHGMQSNDTVDVALSLSGGVSYGSYQGGVNYGIIDFMRRANEGLLDDLMATPLRFRLTATAGASAGNINAFLSALAWCAAELRPPTESLFWNVWIPTGLEQLLPRNPLRGDLSIFDREYFQRHFTIIDQALQEAPGGHCSRALPVGITLTRQDPDSIRVRDLSIPVQRFATVFALRPSADRTRSAFTTYRPDFGREGKAGMIIRFSADTVPLPNEVVTNAIVASSAFPAAFAPVPLSYTRVNDGPVIDSAYFFDGGLFDNNPLSLLFDVQEDGATRGDGSEAGDTVVIYIDPGRRRGRISDVASQRNTVAADSLGPHYGVDMLYNMVSTAVQPARKYELHALARDMAVDTSKKEVLRITSRGPPAFGSTLAAFGAFLGRPLREYDYLAGFYDGLLFSLEEWACSPPEATRAAAKRGDSCTDTRLLNLQSALLERYGRRGWMDARSSSMMALLLADDAGDPRVSNTPAEAPVGDAPLDSLLLQATTRAAFLMENVEGGDVLDSALVFLKNTLDERRLNDEAAVCRNAVPTDPEGEECLVDRTFLNLLDDPDDALSDIQRQVVRRLWRVADFVGDCKQDPGGIGCDAVMPVDGVDPGLWERLLEVVEWNDARTSSGSGLSWNPNTVPEWRNKKALWFGQLFPSWFTFHVSDNGWNLQTNAPLFAEVAKDVSIIVPLGANVWSRGGEFENIYSLQIGAGLAWRGLRAGYTWVGRQPDRFFAFWDLFGLALGADLKLDGPDGPRETRFVLGLSDLPGLIYSLRFIK